MVDFVVFAEEIVVPISTIIKNKKYLYINMLFKDFFTALGICNFLVFIAGILWIIIVDPPNLNYDKDVEY